MPTRINLTKFKSTAALLFVSIALTACSGFTPTTMEAAKCKKDCNSAFFSCKLPSSNCEASLASCLEYCADVDRIKQNKP